MSAETLSALRVLVVDDDIDAAQSLCYLLESMGCEAIGSTDGPEGLALASRFDPHLAIIDLDMPGMEGSEMVRHLRLQDSSSLAMMVCLTGHSAPEDRQRSLAAGFDAFIVKPITQAALTEAVSCTRARSSEAGSGASARQRFGS